MESGRAVIYSMYSLWWERHRHPPPHTLSYTISQRDHSPHIMWISFFVGFLSKEKNQKMKNYQFMIIASTETILKKCKKWSVSFFLSGAWVESLQKFSHSDAADFPFLSSYAAYSVQPPRQPIFLTHTFFSFARCPHAFVPKILFYSTSAVKSPPLYPLVL